MKLVMRLGWPAALGQWTSVGASQLALACSARARVLASR